MFKPKAEPPSGGTPGGCCGSAMRSGAASKRRRRESELTFNGEGESHRGFLSPRLNIRNGGRKMSWTADEEKAKREFLQLVKEWLPNARVVRGERVYPCPHCGIPFLITNQPQDQ